MTQAITGYRTLNQAEIDAINEVKALAEQTRALLVKLEHQLEHYPEEDAPDTVVTSPLRWVGLARDHLQQGFMCLNRAIARPTTF